MDKLTGTDSEYTFSLGLQGSIAEVCKMASRFKQDFWSCALYLSLDAHNTVFIYILHSDQIKSWIKITALYKLKVKMKYN
jgi:hypothetical protein